MKPPHHAGSYQRQAAAIVARAYADPTTRCAKCDRTLEEHGRKWTAGHVVAGQVGGELRPECEPCNYSDGARIGNRRRTQGTTRDY